MKGWFRRMLFGLVPGAVMAALSLSAYPTTYAVTSIAVPTVLVGQDASGAVWSTRLEILNLRDQDIEIGIEGFDNEGETSFFKPIRLLANNAITVPANGTYTRYIEGAGEGLKEGWVKVTGFAFGLTDPNERLHASATVSRVSGSEITQFNVPGYRESLSLPLNRTDVRTLALAVLAGPPASSDLHIVRMTAYAIVNSSNSSSTVTLELHNWGGAGAEVRTVSIELPRHGRRALFLNEIFTDPELLSSSGGVVETPSKPLEITKTGLLIITGRAVGAALEMDFQTLRIEPRNVVLALRPDPE